MVPTQCGMCAEADGRRRVGRLGVCLDICLDNPLNWIICFGQHLIEVFRFARTSLNRWLSLRPKKIINQRNSRAMVVHTRRILTIFRPAFQLLWVISEDSLRVKNRVILFIITASKQCHIFALVIKPVFNIRIFQLLPLVILGTPVTELKLKFLDSPPTTRDVQPHPPVLGSSFLFGETCDLHGPAFPIPRFTITIARRNFWTAVEIQFPRI
jgi:hypothetical protein